MPHQRYESRRLEQPYPNTPLGAFGRLIVKVVLAVCLLGMLASIVPNFEYPKEFINPELIPPELLELLKNPSLLWGYDRSGSILTQTLSFLEARVGSPFVWGPLLIAGLIAIFLEYRRRTAGG